MEEDDEDDEDEEEDEDEKEEEAIEAEEIAETIVGATAIFLVGGEDPSNPAGYGGKSS